MFFLLAFPKALIATVLCLGLLPSFAAREMLGVPGIRHARDLRRKTMASKKKSGGSSWSKNSSVGNVVSQTNGCGTSDMTIEKILEAFSGIVTSLSFVNANTDTDLIVSSDALVQRIVEDGTLLSLSSLAMDADFSAIQSHVVEAAKAALDLIEDLANQREDEFVNFSHVFTDIAPEQVRNQLQILKGAYGNFLDSREEPETNKEAYTESFR